MSLNSAMFTGVSGILTMGNAMNVIGDNIANVNTVGFKGNRSVFADILANSLSNGSTILQTGRGTFTQGISPSWEQGSFETTGNATDVGIQGAGFFVVRNPDDATALFYTRAGQFILDEDGLLVNPQGFVVQGFRVLSTIGGVITTAAAATDISIDGVTAQPRATSAFRIGLNLNAAASAGTTFGTSFDVYNAIGERVTLTYNFIKTGAAQTWNYTVTPSTGTMTAGASGTVTFNATGALSTPAADTTLTITGFPSGASDLTTTWDILDALGNPFNEITGYAAPSTTTSIIQDGFSTGTLRGLAVNQQGVISGLFSNGQTQNLYQLELADFASPWGLQREGGTMFAETAQSGQPLLGTAGSAGLGTILGSALELSNVDLATQFVKMIQNQRGYQANARVITTVDEMMAEAVNLKR
jgi:flagellar hook protein FlgE